MTPLEWGLSLVTFGASIGVSAALTWHTVQSRRLAAALSRLVEQRPEHAAKVLAALTSQMDEQEAARA